MLLRQRDREIHAREQRGRVHPFRAAIGISGRLELAIERLAELVQLTGQRLREIDVAVDRPHRARHHFERRFQFGAVSSPRSQNSGASIMVRITSRRSPSVFAKVSAIFCTSASGGSSATKRMARLFEMKCAVDGMMRQDVEHLEAVVHAAAGRNRHAQHMLLAFVVHLVVEFEIAAALRLGGWSSR